MKKLKNEQGVTILMALLLVLTAAVVSAVILSAALSAARAEASACGGPLCVLRRLRPARSSIQPTRVWPCVENQ